MSRSSVKYWSAKSGKRREKVQGAYVEDFFGDHRGTWLYHLCAVFTRLSAYEVVLPFGIAAGLWLCWRRQAAWPVLFVLASFFPPALITGVLKYTVHRHEPFDLPANRILQVGY